MKIFNVIRSQEWWAHKLPPLLAIAYATVLRSTVPLYNVALWAIFLLASLVVGAIYVSVINDITDLEEDLASGKSNRVQQIPARFRWLIPAVCILLGCVSGYFLYPDYLSCLLYSASWIVFSLYSINPVRLKNRGIFGVLADGCGSHVFTGLLMVSSMSYVTNQDIDWLWFTSVGIWSFTYGLRGILWHQFADRENDLKVNLNTYATGVTPEVFKKKSKYLIFIELIALGLMLFKIGSLLVIIGLCAYILLITLRYRINKTQIITILKENNKPFQIFMADYYQMFFPLSLLLAASLVQSVNLIVLAIHIILFPYILWLAIFDYIYFARAILVKKYRNF